MNHIIKKLNLKNNQKVLDIGSGWGTLAIEIAKQSKCEVTGITLSENQLKYSQNKVKELNLENQVNFVYLALGSNLGDKKNNLNKSIDLIQKEGIFIKKRSKFYSTKSWPNENFPNFINSIILIETILNVTELFLKIKKIEKKLGRTKSKKNYPRICDIDIIDFNGEIIHRKLRNHK